MFATGAQAQVECSGGGPYEVPHDWTLKPSGLSAGDNFRLLFATSTTRRADATDIATYNTFVQTRAKAGHSAITDSCGNQFKVLGSTSTVDARNNTATTGTGQAIYWLNGAKAADNYSDFYDGSWDSYVGKTEAGANISTSRLIATGTNQNGTRHSSRHLGSSSSIRVFQLQHGGNPMGGSSSSVNSSFSFYALSPIFTVGAAPTTVSISAPTDANEGNSGTTDKFFTISLSSALTQNLSLKVCYTGTATRGASDDYQFLSGSVVINGSCSGFNISAGGTTSSTTGIRIRGDTAAEPDETVIATLSFTGSPPAGVVLGTSTATYTILDDDDTTAPGVTSIERQSPSSSPTNADSLTWRVTFSEAVRNVDTTDFSLVIINTSTAFPQTTLAVSSVSTSVYDITASGNGPVHAEGHIQLVFASGHDIEDLSGNALPASPMVSGTNDNSFQLDNTAPTVTSITRQMPTTAMTDADSLTWRVTFDDAMQHVNAADFQVSGTTATITAVSPVTGSETTAYDVTATGGNLAGLNATVTLSFANTHNIEDEAGNDLAASPTPTGTDHNTFVVQNTATSVTVSISAPANANEGNSGTTDKFFTITLSSALSAIATVQVCYTGTATRGATADYQFLVDSTIVNSACQNANIAAGATTTTLYGMRINGDTDAERDETVIATLSDPPADMVLGTSTATYTILNDDGTLTEPMVTIEGGHDVREGRGAAFTLTASPAPTWDQAVNISVTETGTFLAGSPGTRTVTIPSGQTSHSFTVATENDGGRDAFGNTQGQESDGSVTATVDSGTGYTLGSPSSATVTILDDDTNAASGNFINVWGRGPATLNEDSRGSRHFMVKRWGHDSGGNSPTGNWGFKLCFTGTATPGADYTLNTHFAEEPRITINADGCTDQRTISGSSNRYHFYIWHVDDPHAEGDETIVVTATSLVNVHLHQQPYTDTDRFTIVDDDTPAPPKPQQDEDAQPAQIETPSCVSDALLADVDDRIANSGSTAGTERWTQVKNALTGQSNAITLAEVKTIYDRRTRNGWSTSQWDPVIEAMECLAAAPEEQPEQAEVQPVTPATPELSLRAGSAVDEGGNAAFTVTADPAPQSDLTIAWTVAQSGEYLAAPGAGSRTVVLTAGATSAALSVATVDDSANEADGSVSVTLGTGTGYSVATGKGSAAVTVRDNDATPATPELSLSAGSAVDEGGNAAFTVTANPAPTTDLTIAWTVAQSGEYLDAPGAGSRTATLAAGTASVALSVATVDDTADEADGSVSVTLGTGTGYTVATGKGSAAVAVRDNDEPVVSIAAGSGVTEGAAASFTVSASPAPAAPLDVTLTVGQSGDFAASGETGSRTVTVPVTGSVDVEVATVDDGADEPDGSVTATVDTGTGYTVAAAPDNAATVAVSDNDAAAAGPTISIADASFTENERYGYFTVTLSEKTDHDVRFAYATRDSTPVSATANADYVEIPRAWRIGSRIKAGKTQARFWIPIRNDSHDEDPETFEVELFDAFVWRSGKKVPVSIADGVAVGTITNSDPMPAAWLARFGRTAAEQALDGIAGRIAAPRSAGVQGTIAGQALDLDPGSGSGAANDNAAPGSLAGNDLLAQSEVARAFGAGGFGSAGPDGFGPLGPGSGPGQAFGQDRFGGGGVQSRSMTGREALLGSSFTATGEKDGTGGSLAFWGRAAQSSFDGREGTFSLDGEATAAMLGADYARGKWLVGMALMQSSGEGGYADRGSGPQHCPDVDDGTDPAIRALPAPV